MLGTPEVESVRDFVVRETAWNAETEEADPVYFRAQIGPRASSSKGPLSGVYTSKHETIRGLQDAVLSHISQVWDGEGHPARVWLCVFAVGAKKPSNYLPLDFPEGSLASGADVDIDPSQPHAATVALTGAVLQTNHMLREMLDRRENTFLSLIEDSVETKARLLVAEAEVRLGGAAAEERRVTMMFDRLDPHLESVLPTLMKGFMLWASNQEEGPPQAATEPTDPDAAADWHVNALVNAGKAMAIHFMSHPDTLTEPREAKLTEMVGKLVQAGEALK